MPLGAGLRHEKLKAGGLIAMILLVSGPFVAAGSCVFIATAAPGYAIFFLGWHRWRSWSWMFDERADIPPSLPATELDALEARVIAMLERKNSGRSL